MQAFLVNALPHIPPAQAHEPGLFAFLWKDSASNTQAVSSPLFLVKVVPGSDNARL